MNQLYPFAFEPIFHEKIWGGNRIANLGYDIDPNIKYGELWSLSAVETDPSVVSNGFLAGNTLNELIEIYMDELVGEAVFDKYGNAFPLLVKILDANDWLSVQVHPNDVLAKERGLGRGKSEMWYVMDAKPDAQLIMGFNKTINEHSFLRALEDKTLVDSLAFVNAPKSSAFYMPAGRVHALGPGLLIAEIQQSSDTTYRIYDWDRVEANGKARDLHIEEALAAIDFSQNQDEVLIPSQTPNCSNTLVESPYFTTYLIRLQRAMEKDYSDLDSFVIWLVTSGKCSYTDAQGNKGQLQAGQSLLLPATTQKIQIFPLSGNCELIEVYVVEAKK